MALDARERWFARMVQAGLEESIFGPEHVLAHASPDVLAQHIPAELMSKVLQASLTAGAMTPARVLETLTADVLAKHIPHEILWNCISSAAEAAGIPRVANS
jgi:hypothetical protein